MSLFSFGNKNVRKKNSPACTCNDDRLTSKEEMSTDSPHETKSDLRCIKVLGAGCKSCHEQYEQAKKAVKNIGLTLEVEYITDLEKIMAYGVMSMPALVVNEKVVSMGKILKAADVEKLLHELGF